VRSRAAARRTWIASSRDLAGRSEYAAITLDEAAVVLSDPIGADRRVWLDAGQTCKTLVAAAVALVPDAPSAPDDRPETDGLASMLERLRTDLTVLGSAALDAERTRFELVGPTPEQLEFASRSVRQACAAVTSSAHALMAALDRLAPPSAPAPDQPQSPT
jgi:hypothetical protein